MFALYFFNRHNTYCEPGSKLSFGINIIFCAAYQQLEELFDITYKFNGLAYFLKFKFG